ncbi:unnamed protein product, partial [Rodentolepis nana]|uniref:PI3K/PI4K domain-containing protein n=1 Tax=Rodentolepis nana TaxID=102285 RepID=A0A0R3TIR0_RODNA
SHGLAESENFEYLSPVINSDKIRRASCPDTVIPGFAKRLAVKNFLGVVPMASLTQLAGPPIPVLPLGNASLSGNDDSVPGSGTTIQGRYEAALERFTASYRTRTRQGKNGGDRRNGHESPSTRPILPGQKTHIRIHKNASLSLGISLIGGCETSLVSTSGQFSCEVKMSPLYGLSLHDFLKSILRQPFQLLTFACLTH